MKSIITQFTIITITLSLVFTVHTYAEIDFSTARGIWLLDEGDGTVINDISGNENHGELQGGEWVEGPDGPALSLDGVNDRVIIADSDSLYLEEGMDDYCLGFCEYNRERFWTYSRQKTGIWNCGELRVPDKRQWPGLGSLLCT